MTHNIPSNPIFLLTHFTREGKWAPKADSLEKFGNFACGLLQLSCGTKIKVSKEFEWGNIKLEAVPRSLIKKITTATITAFLTLLTLPFSLPFFIAGAICLKSSKSHKLLFQQLMLKSTEKQIVQQYSNVDFAAKGCQTVSDAIQYVINNKSDSANLLSFSNVTDEHLKELAMGHPSLKKLCILADKITEVPSLFKNLRHLELHFGGGNHPKLPEDLSKLKTLVLNCCNPFEMPKTLHNLKHLYLIESPLKTLPENLKKLELFNRFNSPHISKEEEARKLPKQCIISSDHPKEIIKY